MAPAEIRAIARSYGRRVRSVLSPKMVVLFGSQVGGEAGPSSDIDIAVVVDRVEGDYLDVQAALYRARREIDDRIEPVLLESDRDPSGFLESVLARGEVIFPEPVEPAG
ncbi:MAG: nucleotidyltransferase domain-containing protein [Acidobacteria bacterium]|nr:nucleotidyltransferase domain-containing protein [Acidobacteriota bacterium]